MSFVDAGPDTLWAFAQVTHLLPGFPMEVAQQQELQVEPEHCVMLDCAKADSEQLVLQKTPPAAAASATVCLRYRQ
jgi:hypothetical protein